MEWKGLSRGTRILSIALVIILLFCETAWLVFVAPTDVTRYQCYALTFWLGSHGTSLLPQAQCAFLHIASPQPAFHMLPIEYPPLTILLFSLALAAPLPYYQLAFALLMVLTVMLVYWLLLRSGPRGSALLFALYLVLGACAIVQVRFDILPAALTLLCAIAVKRNRWTTAYVALAFGVLLKLYPILLLPALFIAEQQTQGDLSFPAEPLPLRAVPEQIWHTSRGALHWQWKPMLTFLGILLVVTGGFALLNFQGAILSPLSYFAQRPAQIESIDSSVLWLARQFGASWQVVYSYGSLNVLSNVTGAVSLVGTCGLALGVLLTLWLQWRRRIDFVQTCIALLLVLIATGKVFSPQYLIWLIPLLAYAGANTTFWMWSWGAISLLTTFIYIFFYSHLSSPESAPQTIQSLPGFFAMVGIRNALLVFTALAYLCNWFQAREHRRTPPPA
ncbi:MAG: DUF2029 domain-containing protein [Ktedonobacteraceae bacterium]|nr:DUF2029 domain-containing protein [Ktedonobacteraceae bacterium]